MLGEKATLETNHTALSKQHEELQRELVTKKAENEKL